MINSLIALMPDRGEKVSDVVAHPEFILGDTAEQSSYFIARTLMRAVEWLLNLIGLGNNETAFIWIYTILVFAVAILFGYIVKWILVKTLDAIGPHLSSDFYKRLVQRKFFTKLCRVVPPLVFIILIQFTLTSHQTLASWLTRLSFIYIVAIISMTLCTVTDVVWAHLDERENKRNLPLSGIVQVVKLIIWIIGVIVIAAILFNKSPAALLAGLGAFAAVLMLVFKDSILGVVAGVQLAENDSLHVGDWIVPNGSDANGTVVEVGLTAVKIENWDKTISTIPPYSLITSGFKNYRNMQQSNTRRIQRSYMIDADSVVETTDAMLAEFSEVPFMKGWIAEKIKQREAGNEQNVNNSAGLADGSIDTNLGVFRAYLQMYLQNNPNIDKGSTCFISTLAQTSTGIPLQIYCFTSTSSWIPYEGIQSGIFEHIAAMLYRFHLYAFENPSGRDTIIDGYLSPGKDPESLFGLPYPFFNESGTPANPGIPPQWLYSSPSAYCGMKPGSTPVSSNPSGNGKGEGKAR